METTSFRRHALVPKSRGTRRNLRLPNVDPNTLPFLLGNLAPQDRRTLAYIAEYGDFLEAAGRRFLLVPMVQKIEDSLAAFQSEAADLEPEIDVCAAEDDRPGPHHGPGDGEDSEPTADDEVPAHDHARIVTLRRTMLKEKPGSGRAVDWFRENRARAAAVDFAAEAVDRKGSHSRLSR